MRQMQSIRILELLYHKYEHIRVYYIINTSLIPTFFYKTMTILTVCKTYSTKKSKTSVLLFKNCLHYFRSSAAGGFASIDFTGSMQIMAYTR